MAIDSGLLYEVNEKGEPIVVKSMESNLQAFIRFTNRTNRPVDVWWRDYQGIRRYYTRLAVDAHYDVNTFITHPWEFTDVITEERYVVNNNPVFRAPQSVGGMNYRTNWNICICMRTLREAALFAVASRVQAPRFVEQLELPLRLQTEVQKLVEKLVAPAEGPGE